MKLFFDTSALLKKYINENGSGKVDELCSKAKQIFVSAITEIELFSAIRRLFNDNAITDDDFKLLKKEIEFDFNYFYIIDFDKIIIQEAKKLLNKYQIKTLDSIQLSSVSLIKNEIDYFIVSDTNLKKYSLSENIKIIDPCN